jgi:hypothetical protein
MKVVLAINFFMRAVIVKCVIADPKIPASGFDVIIATTIGRDDILPSGILVLWGPGWEYT